MIKYFVLGADNPFLSIKKLLDAMFNDVLSTFITVFCLGFLFCALMLWKGSEESAPKFQKGLIGTIIGIVVFTLAKVIVAYVQAKLK